MSIVQSFSVQSVGSFIPGGIANAVLYINASGILSNSTNFTYNGSAFNFNGACVINDSGAGVDTRIEGDTNTHLLLVQGTTDRVGINNASPLAKLHVEHTSEQLRTSYDASNYLSFVTDLNGFSKLTSAANSIELADNTGTVFSSSGTGTDLYVTNNAYSSYLHLGYAVDLRNGNDTSMITLDGAGAINLYAFSGAYLTLVAAASLYDSTGSYLVLDGSGGALLYSNVGAQVQISSGNIYLNASSGATLAVESNITLTLATSSEFIVAGLPTGTATSGALYYDSMTNQVYYNP